MGEAIDTAVYIINYSPTKALVEMILEEAFTGYKFLVSHLCVFESDEYVHISDTTLTKFVLGYSK